MAKEKKGGGDKGGGWLPKLGTVAELAANYFLDPLLEKWMGQVAAKIPKDSPLRNSAQIKGIIAAAKGLLEDFAKKTGGVSGYALEKVTDIGDFFAGSLSTKEGVSVAKDWMEKFFAEAQKTLAGAKNADEVRERYEKLKADFRARICLFERIQMEIAERKEPEAPTPTSSLLDEWEEFWETKIVPTYHTWDHATAQAIHGWRNNQRWIRKKPEPREPRGNLLTRIRDRFHSLTGW